MAEETLFTKIINRDIPADIIYEDDEMVAFKDINPQAPFHCLVVPKKVIPTVNDIREEDAPLIGRLFLTAKKLAADNGLSEDGYRLVFNCNRNAGQEVYHLHLHVLGGRTFRWPPG